MARIVFDAPENWIVRDETEDVLDGENGFVVGTVQSVLVLPEQESDVESIRLTLDLDAAPNEAGMAEDHIPGQLDEYLSEFFPEYYQVMYRDSFLYMTELEDGRQACYFVWQEPGTSEAVIQMGIDIPLEFFGQRASHLVWASVMLKTAVTDVHAIAGDVLMRVSIR